MSKKEKNTKALATYHFEGCVQTLVGAFSTFNIKATKKEVEEYKRSVLAFTIDEMNNAMLPLGIKVKVRKNLHYMKLPKFAQKIYDMLKGIIDKMGASVVECSNGELLEIGVYIKKPTSKNPSIVKYEEGRKVLLD